MRLKHAIDGYWLENESHLSPRSIPSYQWGLKYLTDFVGEDREIKTITSDDIRRLLNHLKERGLSGKSRSNIWVVLSGFFSWAEKEPALKIPHPIRGIVQQPTFTKKKIVAYTKHELMSMLNACHEMNPWISPRGKKVFAQRPTTLRDKAIIILFVDTGLRASELCGLKIDDYNERSGAIDVLGKGSKERTVIAGMTARKAIWSYLKQQRPDARPDEPLFSAQPSNLPLHVDSLRHLIQRVAERAEVKGATLHRFRHTFAINFLRNGGNVIELKRLLGHEQMETINIYVDLAESDLETAQRRASPADNWRLK